MLPLAAVHCIATRCKSCAQVSLHHTGRETRLFPMCLPHCSRITHCPSLLYAPPQQKCADTSRFTFRIGGRQLSIPLLTRQVMCHRVKYIFPLSGCSSPGVVAWTRALYVSCGRTFPVLDPFSLCSRLSSKKCFSAKNCMGGQTCGEYSHCYFRTFMSHSNTDADNWKRNVTAWPSVFHPLLAGLPQAPLHSKQSQQQQQCQKAATSATSTLRYETPTNTAASLGAVSTVVESQTSAVSSEWFATKASCGIFYVIHTFRLHPYEAVLFEEAVYRFLGQRTVNREHVPGASLACNSGASAAEYSGRMESFDWLDGDQTLRQSIYVSGNHLSGATEDRRSPKPQQYDSGVWLTVTQQQQKTFLQKNPTGKHVEPPPLLLREQQPRRQEKSKHLHTQPDTATSLPTVACAFLHHPPYCPGWAGSTSHQLSRPSRAIVLGLSGRPAAFICHPEKVLRQQRALFIKRFSGGGTVLIGSGSECFCVGLLLPHSFSGCRPYPQELFEVCTDLYLGKILWSTDWCLSPPNQKTPTAAVPSDEVLAGVPNLTAPPASSSPSQGLVRATDASSSSADKFKLLNTSAACKATAGHVEEAGMLSTDLTSKPPFCGFHRSTLAALSPFVASRFGLLQNDYVVTFSNGSSICARSDLGATRNANGNAPALTASSNSVGACPLRKTCPQKVGAAQPTASTAAFSIDTATVSPTFYKVGGNAQALSRHYGLQHTSFIWDEKQLQSELEDLLLLPKKQPEYRGNRPHLSFLRSVRECLKSYVRIPVSTVKQQRSSSVESADGLHSSACVAPHPCVDGGGETTARLSLDTPSSVLLAIGLLLDEHTQTRNFAVGVRRCGFEKPTGREEAKFVQPPGRIIGERCDFKSPKQSTRKPRISCVAADTFMKGRGDHSTKQQTPDEGEWECVHCVMSSDGKIPEEFKRLWDGVDHWAYSRCEILPESEAGNQESGHVPAAVDAGNGRNKERPESSLKTATNEQGRRLHVLPIEAVRSLVYELFKGSLRHVRSTHLVDASGREILEKEYKNIFEVNNIVPC